MNNKRKNGITLIALIITIIILLILAGVAIKILNGDGIINNTINVVEQSKIGAKKEEIELAIIGKISTSAEEITIDKIIENLEKKGIIDEGNSNEQTGEVKTNPDGYVYEIKEKPNGDWEVKYVGKGDIDAKVTIQISATPEEYTTKDVTVTVIWTNASKSMIKEISVDGGKNYTQYTENKAIITISENCVIEARVRKNSETIISESLEIKNIDKNPPTVTAKQEKISKIADGTENFSVEDLFNIERKR